MSPNPFEPTPQAVKAAAVALWAQTIAEMGLTRVLPYGALGEERLFEDRARAALIAAARANGMGAHTS